MIYHLGSSRLNAHAARIDFGEDATVLVGADEKRFTAHRDILLRSSTFFRSALTNAGWREAQEKIVRLPEHDAASFTLYLHWLYNKRTDLLDSSDGRLTTNHEEVEEQQADSRYQRLVDCYALGSYLGDDKFCDTLISHYFRLRRITKRWPSSATCNRANRSLSRNSRLRDLIVHHIAFSVSRDSLANSIDDLDPEFVKDMALAAVKSLENEYYHETAWDRGEDFYRIIKEEDRDSDSGSDCLSDW